MEESNGILVRFTRMESLFEMFALGGIPLFGTERWDDLCDRALVERGCKALDVTRCGIMCFMDCGEWINGNGKENEDRKRETYAHWKVYGTGKNVDVYSEALSQIIRIDFKRSELEKCVVETNVDAVLGKVDYKEYGEYCSIESHDNPCKLLFEKRNAYEWEQESRLVVFDQDLKFVKRHVGWTSANAFIRVENFRKLIKGIVYSPFCTTSYFPSAPRTKELQFYALKAFAEWKLRNSVRDARKLEYCEMLLRKGHRSGILDNDRVLSDAAKSIKRNDWVLKELRQHLRETDSLFEKNASKGKSSKKNGTRGMK